MNKEELEGYIEELCAIHRDSVDNLSEITNSNKKILNEMRELQKEIASSVHNVKVYNNRFIACSIALLVLILIIFGWKFSNYNEEVQWHLSSIEKSQDYLLEGMTIQVKLLKRIEDLEKNKSEINNGNLGKSMPKSKLQDKGVVEATITKSK